MKITSEIIISWKPCTPYTPERVRELVTCPMTPEEILALPIPAADRLWVVLRDEVLSKKILRQFAADCAQSVVHLCSDPRYQIVIDIAIGHAVGVVPDEVLTEADECARKASETARAAVGVTGAAARAAASASRAAAWAAEDAAWAASGGAAASNAALRDVGAADMQVKQLITILENNNGRRRD